LAVECDADLPNAIADADEPAIVEIDVGLTSDDVDTETGVEPKLRARRVFVAVPVRRCMRRRTGLVNRDGPASTR
jgi:hypothetical protein